LFLEMELAVNYQPQNWYCYAPDAKSSPDFHKKIRALAKCVPNVLITQRELIMDSAGHNMVTPCLNQNIIPIYNWVMSSDISVQFSDGMHEIVDGC
jgi:hypothetical protein